MSFISGVLRVLYIKVDDDFLPVGCLTSNSFSESSTMLGTTTRDNADGWQSSIPTAQNYSIPFDGVLTDELESVSLVTYYMLQSLKRNRTLIDWRIESVEGEFETGQGYISDLGNTNTIDEFVSFSGLIIGLGLVEAAITGFLLLETGDYVLLTTNDKVIL